MRQPCPTALLGAVLLLLTAPAGADEAAAAPAAALEVTYLANEGFLLSCGEQKVLIDAFVPEPYFGYPNVPAEVFARMLTGQPPFDGVQLALVSHRHRDHFQPDAAADFLRRHPETLLVSSPEVVDELRAGDAQLAEARAQARRPEPGQTFTLEHQGIRVDFLRLAHGGSRWAELHNLGHVIHLCGRRILHIGDADGALANYAPYAERLSEVDVSLIPAWFFRSPTDRPLLERYLLGRHNVAVHVAAGKEKELAAALRESHPGVVVFQAAMQSKTF